MWQQERHRRIRALLGTLERVPTERIVADLGVSRETVRRDLLELEARGELRRIHGGVVSAEASGEPPLEVRAAVRVREKRAIARAAMQAVRAGQTLLVDAGSTTSILAEQLALQSGLLVVTNSLQVAMTIAGNPGAGERGTRAHLLGGGVDAGLAATFGEATIAEIHRHHADLALLSPVGIDGRYGATSFDPREAEVARAMAVNAERTIILADHAKLGVTSRVAFCAPTAIDLLITDAAGPKQQGFAGLKETLKEILVA